MLACQGACYPCCYTLMSDKPRLDLSIDRSHIIISAKYMDSNTYQYCAAMHSRAMLELQLEQTPVLLNQLERMCQSSQFTCMRGRV